MTRRCFLTLVGGTLGSHIIVELPTWAEPERIGATETIHGDLMIRARAISEEARPWWRSVIAGRYITLENGVTRYKLLVTSARHTEEYIALEVTGEKED